MDDVQHHQPRVFRDLATLYLNSSFPEPKCHTRVTERVFKAHFKLSSLETAKVWYKMRLLLENTNCVYKTNDTPPQSVSWDNNALPEHLLWTLHYMKTYLTEDQTAVLFGTTNKTFRKYFWAMVHFLSLLCSDLVSTNNNNTSLLTIDMYFVAISNF